MIAALLALTKNSVHIATSNIKLAKRDFVEIYDFYEKLGIKSVIMLHQNELIEDSDKKEVLQCIIIIKQNIMVKNASRIH